MHYLHLQYVTSSTEHHNSSDNQCSTYTHSMWLVPRNITTAQPISALPSTEHHNSLAISIFLAIYWTKIPISTLILDSILNWEIQFLPFKPIFVSYTLISPFHLSSGLPSGPYPSAFLSYIHFTLKFSHQNPNYSSHKSPLLSLNSDHIKAV